MARRKPSTLSDLAFAAFVAACALAGGAALQAEGAAVPLLLAILTVTLLALGACYAMLRRADVVSAGTALSDPAPAGPLLDALPTGVLLFDAEGSLMYSNKAWRDFTSEYGVVDGAGDPLTHYRHFAGAFRGAYAGADSADTLTEGMRRVLAGEAPGFDGEFALQVGAQTRWLRVTVRPFGDGAGRAIAVMPLDVTEHHLAEERRDLLGAALNASAHAVVITDARAVIEWANPAFATLAGRSPDETIGCTPAELLRNSRDDTSVQPVGGDSIARGETAGPEQAVPQPPEGVGADDALSITPVRDRHGVLRHFVAIREDAGARKRNEREPPRQASLDALTGVRNRRAFLDEATLERARVRRYGRRSALLVLDVDHFAHINEAHGRAVGDAVLKHFARLISTRIRQTDIIGRLDGEEFGLLLTETDLEGAMELGERLRRKVNASVIRRATVEIRLTVSIGIAGFKREDPNVDAVLARAANALRLAKSGGRNRVECAQAE
ncbi:MAG TPA: diguanylate cyclase [Rhodocyclaceae bacterium]|nr:diguanylate cyclase [Rhodocyclaceae bacterium]